MNKYILVGKYTLAEGQLKDTCEHCGRAIKSVYLVKDNTTGSVLKIGSTCIGKVMNLNESFSKAVLKAVKKYDKEYNKYLESLDIISSFNKSLKIRIDLGAKNTKQLKEDTLQFVIEQIFTNIHYLIEETKRFNSLSKQGLINLKNLKDLQEEQQQNKIRFQLVETKGEYKYKINDTELIELLK